MKKVKKSIVLFSIAIATLFSCCAKHDTAKKGVTPTVALVIPEPEIPRLPKARVAPLLPLLSEQSRIALVEAGERAMDESWKAAREHTPEGFAFVRGGRYKRFGSARGNVQEEDLLSYYMSDHEVTQAEYESVMGANPSARKGDDLPVENVSWYNAIEYCNKRSLAEGLTPYYYYYTHDNGQILIENSDWDHVSGKSYLSNQSNDDYATGYRLPSDAEWEYAANGGVYRTNMAYSGDDKPDEASWTKRNAEGRTRAEKGKKPNALGLYDMSGNVMEWTDTQTGYWDTTCVRGGSWSDDDTFTVNSVDSYDVDEARDTLGFRVVRNVPLEDMRYPAVVFSDNLNVRDAPSIDGNKVEALPTMTPVAVYGVSGSGELKGGTLDLWLKIADSERWVNAYYVAMLPFFTRETGRVNTFAELAYDVTDAADVHEPGFQLYWVDRQTGALIVENEYRDTYYRDTFGLYGLPEYPDAPIKEEWLYSLPNERTEHKWWSAYAKYESADSDEVFDTYSWASMCFDVDHTLVLDEDMAYPIDMDWSFLGGNRVSFWSEGSGKHLFSVYFTDERHMVLWERIDGEVPVDSVYWLCAWPSVGDEYLEDIDVKAMSEDALRAQGLKDREPLVRLLSYNYDSPGERQIMWENVAALIDRNVPVSYADRIGKSPLHYAAEHWDEGAIRSLLAAGANPYYRSLSDELPIDLVTEMHWDDSAGTESGTFQLLKKAMDKK